MKYTTEEGLRKLRAIAERAYVRGSETCKVSPAALLAVLDEIKAVEQPLAPDVCPACRGNKGYRDAFDEWYPCQTCDATGKRR